MNRPINSSLFIHYKKKTNVFFKIVLALPGLLLSITAYSQGSDDTWQNSVIPQMYWQGYADSIARDSAYNAGLYLVSEYLDSSKFRAGYNYTVVNLKDDADITEHMFYLSGEHSMFPDMLPGKLIFRLDGYRGQSTLEYNVDNPPVIVTVINMGGGKKPGGSTTTIISGGSTTIKQSADITAFQPQLAFSNYAKTFYADIGYAYSKYEGTSKVEVDQFTPTIGFGWNDGYDWLQLRLYLIKIHGAALVFSDNQLESLETKYTYWFKDDSSTNMDFVRLSLLAGERALAVDSDAGVIYSTADKQNGSLQASIQWKLSDTSSMLTLVNYSRFVSDALLDNYDSVLLYVNLQHKW